MIEQHTDNGPRRAAMRAARGSDENSIVGGLLDAITLTDDQRVRTETFARALVSDMRRRSSAGGDGGLDAFLNHFGLTSREGIILMCLAEALLRVPDSATLDKLIQDKLAAGDWARHVGRAESLFVNASTWALMLTGRVIRLGAEETEDLGAVLGRLVARSGEPVIRAALSQAMRILARQFVLGRTIEEALEIAEPAAGKGARYSFDMLGEAALTQDDADRYLDAYHHAIDRIGRAGGATGPIAGPGISVKLSALHPRYGFTQRDRVLAELAPRLATLAARARQADIGLTIDAEEADRLELSLDLFASLARDPSLAGWNGLGLAVQAYQKQALSLVDWLADLSASTGRRLMVRLVKGAYWDSEIKVSQELGHSEYPIFTRKANTDLSFIACAERLLARPEHFYPQFATHNAHTVAVIRELAGGTADYELQKLHGMGEALYTQLAGLESATVPVRTYAPVGSHEDLLPYLVRRLLENGANTSFVNRFRDETLSLSTIIADPIARARGQGDAAHPNIPRPPDLFGPERRNSAGLDLADSNTVASLYRQMAISESEHVFAAEPIVDGATKLDGPSAQIRNPADPEKIIGEVILATEDHRDAALAIAAGAAPAWSRTPVETRARALEKTADLFEAERATLALLAIREAGKTLPDALAEVREAVDLCRYYAARARLDFAAPILLPGPTGEERRLTFHGRGVFACISPWNFPLAIFAGQIAAALVAGNGVIAKPAEETPLIAAAAVRLFHRAGIPADILHFLPGDGPTIGAGLCRDTRIDGIVFTGSTETARNINHALAERDGPIVPLIAETGGINAMIVDSTALPEQVVEDVVASAFQSAGQRCSALRLLFLQEEIADRILSMLRGAMAELRVADPFEFSTDVGPIITSAARDPLLRHIDILSREAASLFQTPLGKNTVPGWFVAPTALEIGSPAILRKEIFGPILHIVRFAEDKLDDVIAAINACGYGLTFGIHSRIDTTVAHVSARIQSGNIYVNRTMIGAVPGVHPFGGERLSGTGPKAGGPHYLHRFASEQTIAVNTTATGGNASLLTLDDDFLE